MHYTLYDQKKKQSFIRKNWPLMAVFVMIGGAAAAVGSGALQGRSVAEVARHWHVHKQKYQDTYADLHSRRARHKDLLWNKPVTAPSSPSSPSQPTVPSNPSSPGTSPVIGTGPVTTPLPTTTPNPVLGPVTNPSPLAVLPDDVDHREYMHGLDFIKLGGRDMVVFSSNGYTPTSPADEWMHDIYYSYVDPADPSASFSAKSLVAARMAQEPASSAVNSNGKLMVTAEDAEFSDYLDQTYGLWDTNLKATTPYGAKLMPPQGGHSGHVAASGDKFLVSFSDGWIDGGGVNNLGTGDEVYAKIVNDDGTTGSMINTAVGTSRDWWPIVAGSDTNWLQVWQRYGTPGTGGGTVMGAIIDHSGKIVKQLSIFTNNKYYYHDVQYIPALGVYLVTGSQNTSSNAGIAVLINKNGDIVATKTGLPNTNRESQTVISSDGKTAVYAVPGTGAAVLDLTPNSVNLRKTVSLNWNWDYMGTDGIFTADSRVVFATGTQKGVKFLTVDL